MFEKALELIRKYDRIIIHRHSNPDGDALGSQVGLYYLIKDNFPEKTVYMVGDNSGRYQFIPGRKMDEIPDEAFIGALSIILDTSIIELLSDTRYTLAETSLRIDHHIFVKQFAEVEIIDTSYESCAGMVTDLAIECKLKVSESAAEALYTGIVTDSGRFRYDSTSSETFRRTSFLLKSGMEISPVYLKLYSSSLESVKLRARFTLKIKLTEHKVAYIYTTRTELEDLGITANDATRGYVNTMADIKGVKMWVAFAEMDGQVMCELRSSSYNINPIAVKYGGGGHEKASGATVQSKQIAMKMLNDMDRMAATE